MSAVHVQSTRRLDLAFCGVVLQGPGILSVHLGGQDDDVLARVLGSAGRVRDPVDLGGGRLRRRGAAQRPLVAVLAAYVTAEQARQMVSSELGEVPLHQACVLNLGRFLGRLGLGGEISLGRSSTDDD